jgi:hypothetical protein
MGVAPPTTTRGSKEGTHSGLNRAGGGRRLRTPPRRGDRRATGHPADGRAAVLWGFRISWVTPALAGVLYSVDARADFTTGVATLTTRLAAGWARALRRT